MKPVPTEDISHEMELLRRKMATNGFKWTPQRKEVTTWIFQNHEHFTVDNIIESLREQGNKVPPATVYRVVQMLRDLDFLLEHDFGGEAKFYEHVPGHPHHDHMVCRQCGAIIEFSDAELESLQEKIAKSFGFQIEDHNLVFFGICKNCFGKSKKRK